MFTRCKNCSADVSDDRESCPHCGTAIVPMEESMVKLAGEIGSLEYRRMILSVERTSEPSAQDMTAMRKMRDKIALDIRELEEKKMAESAIHLVEEEKKEEGAPA